MTQPQFDTRFWSIVDPKEFRQDQQSPWAFWMWRPRKGVATQILYHETKNHGDQKKPKSEMILACQWLSCPLDAPATTTSAASAAAGASAGANKDKKDYEAIIEKRDHNGQLFHVLFNQKQSRLLVCFTNLTPHQLCVELLYCDSNGVLIPEKSRVNHIMVIRPMSCYTMEADYSNGDKSIIVTPTEKPLSVGKDEADVKAQVKKTTEGLYFYLKVKTEIISPINLEVAKWTTDVEVAIGEHDNWVDAWKSRESLYQQCTHIVRRMKDSLHLRDNTFKSTSIRSARSMVGVKAKGVGGGGAFCGAATARGTSKGGGAGGGGGAALKGITVQESRTLEEVQTIAQITSQRAIIPGAMGGAKGGAAGAAGAASGATGFRDTRSDSNFMRSSFTSFTHTLSADEGGRGGGAAGGGRALDEKAIKGMERCLAAALGEDIKLGGGGHVAGIDISHHYAIDEDHDTMDIDDHQTARDLGSVYPLSMTAPTMTIRDVAYPAAAVGGGGAAGAAGAAGTVPGGAAVGSGGYGGSGGSGGADDGKRQQPQPPSGPPLGPPPPPNPPAQALLDSEFQKLVHQSQVAKVSHGTNVKVESHLVYIQWNEKQISKPCVIGLSIDERLSPMPNLAILGADTLHLYCEAMFRGFLDSLLDGLNGQLFRLDECCICLDDKVDGKDEPNCVIYPCHHQCCHASCIKKGNIQKCPICRIEIRAYLPIELTSTLSELRQVRRQHQQKDSNSPSNASQVVPMTALTRLNRFLLVEQKKTETYKKQMQDLMAELLVLETKHAEWKDQIKKKIPGSTKTIKCPKEHLMVGLYDRPHEALYTGTGFICDKCSNHYDFENDVMYYHCYKCSNFDYCDTCTV